LSSVDFPITFRLRADDRASENLRAVNEVIKNGSQASVEARIRVDELSRATSLQSRAISSMRNQWVAANTTLLAVGRTLSTVGSIGRQMLTILSTMSLAALQIGSAQRSQQAAQEEVNLALRAYNEMLDLLGPKNEDVLEAWGDLQEAEDNLADATRELNRAQQQMQFTNIASVLTIAGMGGIIIQTIPTVISYSASMRVAWASALLLNGVLISMVAQLAIIGGFVAFALVLGTAANAANDLWTELGKGNITIEDIEEKFKDLPPVLREIMVAATSMAVQINEALPAINVTAIEEGLANALTNMGQWGADVQAGFVEWFGGASTTVSDWVGDVETFFGNLVTRAGAILGVLGVIIGESIKSALNVAIDIINSFISFVNNIIGSINAVLPPGFTQIGTIAEIPSLAAGGIVTKPTLALIGEAGPEAVVPLSGAGGGIGGNVIIHVHGSIMGEEDVIKVVSRGLFLRGSRSFR